MRRNCFYPEQDRRELHHPVRLCGPPGRHPVGAADRVSGGHDRSRTGPRAGSSRTAKCPTPSAPAFPWANILQPDNDNKWTEKQVSRTAPRPSASASAWRRSRAGPRRTSAITSSAAAISMTAARPVSWAIWAVCSPSSRTTTSIISTISRTCPARRSAALKCTRPST